MNSGTKPVLRIEGATLAEGESGSTAFNFTVRLDRSPFHGRDVTVRWTTADDSAKADSDYRPGSSILTFTEGGPLTQTITVDVWGDAVAEEDESFTVALSSPTNAVFENSAETAAAVGRILGDEGPGLSIADARKVEGNSGTSTMEFVVSLSRAPAPGTQVTAAWATADGGALAGTDYTAASGTLTFAPGGALTQTIRVDFAGDTAIEGDESFSVKLSNAAGGGFADASATGTILADDFPDVSIASFTQAEGNTTATAFNFVVTLTARPPPGLPLKLDWTTSAGTAATPADFVEGNGQLTFTSTGSLSQTITVLVIGDRTLEADETFTVTVGNFVNGPTGSREATGTILSDDLPGLSISDAEILEGTAVGSTTLAFTVSLDNPPMPGRDITVNWSTTSGTAIAGTDFTSGSGSLTFTSADPQTVSVMVNRDVEIEADETFTVTLSGPTNSVLVDGSGVGRILADDFPVLSIGDSTTTEGHVGTKTFSFPVTLSAAPPSGYPVTVNYATSNGTALAGSDYQAKTGTLSFYSYSSLTQSATVSIIGDTQQEPDETFIVTLSGVTNASLGDYSANGTIQSDDLPSASISHVTLVEGSSGSTQAVFTVRLAGEPLAAAPAQLSWTTVDGTALGGTDYQAATGNLTFSSGGAATQTLTVDVNGDTAIEPDEFFGVRLTATSDVVIDQSVAHATILDDEVPTLTISDATVAEGASGQTVFSFDISVNPAPAAGQDVQVWWSTADRTALAAQDYVADSNTLTFTNAGPTSATVTVNVQGDATKETHEEFAVVLTRATNARIRKDRGLGTILDDDGAIIRVDATATGTPDGSSWATAYPTVQQGVDQAQLLGGGQVWVAAARYTNGGGTGPVVAMRSGVSILGGFDGYRGGGGAQETTVAQRDPELNPTVLDGANAAWHVVTGADNAVLDGFVVTGGNANGSGYYAYEPSRRGGGMDIDGVSPVVARCLFKGNKAQGRGGAMYIKQSSLGIRAKPYVHDCFFVANSSVAADGGALYADASDPTVEDSVFRENTATSGSYGNGGAFFDSSGFGLFSRVRFVSNQATNGAGGRSTWSGLTLRRCDFVNNTANTSAGGLYDSQGTLRIIDTTFAGNSGAYGAGGLHLQQSSSMLINSRVENNAGSAGAGLNVVSAGTSPVQLIRVRVANNRATSTGGGVRTQSAGTANPVLVDSVVEGNSAPSGGGLYNAGGSPKLVSSTLFNNLANYGPEMYSSYSSGYSTPTAYNSLIANTTSTGAASAVYQESGCYYCSFDTSASLMATTAPVLTHVPLRTNYVSTSSSASTLYLASIGTTFQVNDVVEVNDDGVPRTVTEVTYSYITISPALAAPPAQYTRVDNWGPGATDLTVDLRPASGSPCIDAGNNALLPADSGDLDGDGDTAERLPLDFLGATRAFDDPGTADTGGGFAPFVDIGAFERVP